MTEESGSIDAPRLMSDEELSTQLAAEDAEANEAPAGEQKYESSDVSRVPASRGAHAEVVNICAQIKCACLAHQSFPSFNLRSHIPC